MKMLRTKTASGSKTVCSVFFAFFFLVSAFNIYPIDPTNKFDFDGDGAADISVYREGGVDRTSPGQEYLLSYWYYQNILTGAASGGQWGRTLDAPVPADFTGDGITDATIFRWFHPEAPPYDFNQVWISGANTLGFGNVLGRKMGRNFDPATPKAEIGEFQRTNVGTRESPLYKYSFYYLDHTDGLIARDTNYPGGSYGTYNQVPVPDDYEVGDGKSEVAVFDTTARCYHVWATISAADPLPQTCFNVGFDTPSPGDYTGDGRADYAAVRITGLTVDWVIKPSSGGSDITGQLTMSAGSTDIKPVVADYDKDGRADLAAVAKVGGVLQWKIRRSNCTSSGCSPFEVLFGFGYSTDLPLPLPYFNDRWY